MRGHKMDLFVKWKCDVNSPAPVETQEHVVKEIESELG